LWAWAHIKWNFGAFSVKSIFRISFWKCPFLRWKSFYNAPNLSLVSILNRRKLQPQNHDFKEKTILNKFSHLILIKNFFAFQQKSLIFKLSQRGKFVNHHFINHILCFRTKSLQAFHSMNFYSISFFHVCWPRWECFFHLKLVSFLFKEMIQIDRHELFKRFHSIMEKEFPKGNLNVFRLIFTFSQANAENGCIIYFTNNF